jgi:2-dehydropantoate 2-reductase
MLQDLEKGLKCEVDYINGAVCEIGGKYNIPAPINKQVVSLVKKIEAGELNYEMSNLNLISVPRI